MAWRPYGNLIEGELDNTVKGRVTGWIRFHREDREPLTVRLELEGNFHADLAGYKIRISNPELPTEKNKDLDRGSSYMDSFSADQKGVVGDMTAGNCCYVDYPYVEWYSEANGRVVIEGCSVQVIGGQRRTVSREEEAAARKRAAVAMVRHTQRLARELGAQYAVVVSSH